MVFNLPLSTVTRPMKLDDLEEVLQIENVNFSYPWTRGNFSDSLNAGYSCWVLLNDQVIIGYAILMMVLDEAHLLNISVDAKFQGQGLGRGLLQYMMKIGREHGGVQMLLEVRATNAPAISLYNDAGFDELATRPNYYPAQEGRENAIIMSTAI